MLEMINVRGAKKSEIERIEAKYTPIGYKWLWTIQVSMPYVACKEYEADSLESAIGKFNAVVPILTKGYIASVFVIQSDKFGRINKRARYSHLVGWHRIK